MLLDECYPLIFISHHLSVVGLRPSSSLSTGCEVSLRGHWTIFCHTGSGRVGRVWSAREKSFEILLRGWELNPGHRGDRPWAIPLSYHDWVTHPLAYVIIQCWGYCAVTHWNREYGMASSSFLRYNAVDRREIGFHLYKPCLCSIVLATTGLFSY